MSGEHIARQMATIKKFTLQFAGKYNLVINLIETLKFSLESGDYKVLKFFFCCNMIIFNKIKNVIQRRLYRIIVKLVRDVEAIRKNLKK
jgi:hypothetical protein